MLTAARRLGCTSATVWGRGGRTLSCPRLPRADSDALGGGRARSFDGFRECRGSTCSEAGALDELEFSPERVEREDAGRDGGWVLFERA